MSVDVEYLQKGEDDLISRFHHRIPVFAYPFGYFSDHRLVECTILAFNDNRNSEQSLQSIVGKFVFDIEQSIQNLYMLRVTWM
jgi:hypothetical protein